MEKEIQKNRIFLGLAGVVLVLLNGVIFVAAHRGSLAPINNMVLWGAFSVLNIGSLLWAVQLLGIQPLVVAVAYVAGGMLAFMGVRMVPDLNVAEITTAGATYGALGALAVGYANTRVRLAFLNKVQIPFIFVIIALLLLDGLLNSQISKAGIGVLLKTLVIPFLFSGAVVGVVWMLLVRAGVGRNMSRSPVAEEGSEASEVEKETQKPERLVVDAPDPAAAKQAAAQEAAQLRMIEQARELEAQKAAQARVLQAERKAEEARKRAEQQAEQSRMLAERKAQEARKRAEQQAEEARVLAERKALEAQEQAEQQAQEARVRAERKAAEEAAAALAAAKEEAELIFSLEDDRVEEVVPDSTLQKILELESKVVSKVEPKGDAAKSSDGADDWLNSHMDLLNGIKK